MKFSYFKNGYKNQKELNFAIHPFQLRIATHQFALWKNYNPIFNFLR